MGRIVPFSQLEAIEDRERVHEYSGRIAQVDSSDSALEVELDGRFGYNETESVGHRKHFEIESQPLHKQSGHDDVKHVSAKELNASLRIVDWKSEQDPHDPKVTHGEESA